jgi:hypothetical protein
MVAQSDLNKHWILVIYNEQLEIVGNYMFKILFSFLVKKWF